MSFDLLTAITSLLAQVKEHLALLDSTFELALRLVNHTDLLIALSFNVSILSFTSHLQALLEELERHVELAALQILISDHLVDTDQVLRDVTYDVDELTDLLRLLKRRFKMKHRRELVEDLFFADTKATMGFRLTFSVVELDGDVEAALVEVGGRFVVVESNILLGHYFVSFETVVR